MSFDRTGIIKHNIHVQTRAVFPPTSVRHCPGIPSCASSTLSTRIRLPS